MALLKIDGTDLPAPTILQPTITDLDSEATGRNQLGMMFRDRIAIKRKVHCEWGILSRTEMSSLLQAMTAASFTLTYPDPQTGQLTAITAYVGDRSPAICQVLSDDDWQWNGLVVDFVEL